MVTAYTNTEVTLLNTQRIEERAHAQLCRIGTNTEGRTDERVRGNKTDGNDVSFSHNALRYELLRPFEFVCA
jgi:hypothetical protein